ncbi:hypothetical protein HYH03_004419 [Edaphochlamys debaryana]|uniref:CTLH domain-containing protein n=1 Tax=Edaphochlamys debaryana TaxID=47281 RepID=A0A836C3C9_9CHLO|nr:hypothetical protein HYH03_004419 [Edaphochlamys debaryana]|eukprot:KAG2497682.1 hypothetical protein HYH03_004419 [Edaphochlamys debaryana]
MAKEPEVALPVLDDIVRDYADGVLAQSSGAWERSRAMRQLLLAGDVDAGLAVMRDICPAALEDARLVFRARKQKFVELLRSGGDAEAALACARSELAPLALDAYPEAYAEFKRLLLLLLTATTTTSAPASAPKITSGGGGGGATNGAPDAPAQPAEPGAKPKAGGKAAGPGSGSVFGLGSGSGAAASEIQIDLGPGGSGSGSGSGAGGSSEPAGLWDRRSTAEFADLAAATVRHLLGLQRPLLGLQLRFLLRLAAAHPPSPGSPAGAAVAELAPRLLPSAAAASGSAAAAAAAERDPAPLPPLAPDGSGGPPASFPEGDVQAVIHGAGTTRAAALEALRHAGGDALAAFRSELGRMRLHEPLLAELALEYGRLRGLLGPAQEAALEAAARGEEGAGAAAGVAAAVAGEGGGPAGAAANGGEQATEEAPAGEVPSPQPAALRSAAAGPGPLSLARAASASPPTKVARRSPPGDDQASAAGTEAAAGAAGSGAGSGSGSGPGSGRGSEDGAAGAAGPGSRGGEGAGPGPGSSAAAKGQEVLSGVLRLAQAGDVPGLLALVEAADPGLWAEQPGLLFDLRRAQYGQRLAAGDIGGALELARSELTPLASAHPSLLPALKSAMAALLPPPPAPAGPPSAPAGPPSAPAGPPSAPAGPPSAPSSASASTLLLLPPPPFLLRTNHAPPPPAPPPPPPPPPPLDRLPIPRWRPWSERVLEAAGPAGPGPGPGPGPSSTAAAERYGGAASPTAAAGVGASRGVLGPSTAADAPSEGLPSLLEVAGTIQAALGPRLGLRGPRLALLMEGLLASHRTWMRAERLPTDPFAGPMRLNALRAAAAAVPPGPTGAQGAVAAGPGPGAGVAAAPAAPAMEPGGGGHPLGGLPPLPMRGRAAAAAAAAAAQGGGGYARPWVEERMALALGMHGGGMGMGGMGMGMGGIGGMGMGGMGYPGAAGGGMGGMGMGGMGMGGMGMDGEDEDLDDEGMGGEGMDGEGLDDDGGGSGLGGGGGMGMGDMGPGGVDEEGVLRLMEILELPRGAAIELLSQHEGDVQAAVLSVMQ